MWQQMNKSLKQQLDKSIAMQLATVDQYGLPWICSVYYVVDDNFNFYWLSLPERKHSEHIQQNNNVAATIAIKVQIPVIGVQIKGKVSMLADADLIAEIMKLYVAKYNVGEKFHSRFVNKINQQEMYKLTPSEVHLFDEVNDVSGQRKRVI